VGLIHIPGGILFFKNRDLSREHLVNQIIAWLSTSQVHALRGVNLKTGVLEGMAMGVNRHRVCVASTHVASTPGTSYDLLCEALVEEVRRSDDVPRVVGSWMSEHRVQGGRILVAGPTWAHLVEVFQERFEIEEVDQDRVITNSFSLLPHWAGQPAIRELSSTTRLEVASRMIEGITAIAQLKAMLRSHLPEKGELSICNHRQDGGGTESSHIIQVQGDSITWSSLWGFPCESNYRTVSLFG
jgi:hypothetical protein